MGVILNTFKSGAGDCIFLRLLKDDASFNIMIDCGKFTAEIQQFVLEKLHKHIDVLVVTHIDCDHVDGVCEMLKEIPEITIGKIFYNCYQLLLEEKITGLTNDVSNDIEVLTKNLPNHYIETKGKINIEHASILASILLMNPQWDSAWEKSHYIDTSQDPFPLGDGFGSLVFLSPTHEDLIKLDENFAREYLRLTRHKAPNTSFMGRETLFELVSRLVSMKQEEREYDKKHKIGVFRDKYFSDRWKKAKGYKPTGVTDENKGSIAFVWEHDDTRVLFMGDAEPDIVKNTIVNKYGQLVNLKAIKVSHHGSKHSTSTELMEVIDSPDFFVTGGSIGDKPSLEALAKIVDRGDHKQRTIHYNYERNTLMKDMASEELSELRLKYNFQIDTNNELEFEY